MTQVTVFGSIKPYWTRWWFLNGTIPDYVWCITELSEDIKSQRSLSLNTEVFKSTLGHDFIPKLLEKFKLLNFLISLL